MTTTMPTAMCGLYCHTSGLRIVYAANDRRHLTPTPPRYDDDKPVETIACPGGAEDSGSAPGLSAGRGGDQR